jgi:hypothetical protein
MEYTIENDLIRGMMQQGEFACLVDLTAGEKNKGFIVQWWCRKTDQLYESQAPTLKEALTSVLGQARSDPNPGVTEEECAETAERYKIQIFIPNPDHPFKPYCEE